MRLPKLRLSEHDLICAIRNRQPNAATALYDMYSASLFGLIKRIINDEQQAQDVLQEAFVKIWFNIDKYDDTKGRLFTWMLNLTRNLAIDHYRSRIKIQTTGLEDIEQLKQLFIPIEPIYARCDSSSIRTSLSKLKPVESSILELLYFQGFTQAEVAAILSMPLGTVKTHSRTALQKLRLLYANEFNLTPSLYKSA